MKYGDRIIKMEGVIVELRDEIVAIDLKGRLGYLEIPKRMMIAEYPLNDSITILHVILLD